MGIEPTHQPWEGRRLPLHHTRPPWRPFRFESLHAASYNPEFARMVGHSQSDYEIRLIERANTIAMVMSEISASTVISALAQRLSGITSAGLKAVEFVNER